MHMDGRFLPNVEVKPQPVALAQWQAQVHSILKRQKLEASFSS